MNLKAKDLLPLLIMLLPFVFLLAVWNNIPDTVPIHYNVHGEADGFTGKSKFPFVLLTIVIMISVVGLVLKVVSGSVDDEKEKKIIEDAMFRVSIALAVFISLVLVLAISQAAALVTFPATKLVGAGILILVAVIFRSTKNVAPNNYVGIRTKWTLNNAEVWKRTHEFCAGNLFYLFMCGAIISLLLPELYALFFSIGWMLLMMFAAIYYSYWLSKKTKNH
jgi:uncharacterized membrane protein